uniref:MULE transposase domain-containing protein n=1 Tax=Solanum lycopersicum TaxID=4081 RepID=A0A3Q7HCB3_SOLLC
METGDKAKQGNNRDKVLVEMPLNKEYPSGIMFENEIGKMVEYEWKPVWCTKCKNYGHELKECRRKQKEGGHSQQISHIIREGEYGWYGNRETFEISNLEEQNAEEIEDSLEDIESNMNVVVPFIPQLGEQELRESYIGMEFQSLDTGFKFYLDYAHRNDFRKEEEKWVIARLVLNHNHELASPNSQKFLRLKRKKSEAQKNLNDLLNNSGSRPSKIASVLTTQAGGIENLNIIGRDIQNYLSTKRQNCLEKGDAQLMLKYFQKRQSDSPGFFYAIQMDVEGHLANCFWVDARYRIAYKNFGDVVLFDTTYLTNEYNMPFVSFTGVNNHHQSILFGCSLLCDETEETFQWLLHTWKEAMFGISPRTIITDQDAAITNAVANVFPNSAHHFCMWHIKKKIPEYLSHVFHEFDDFKNDFSKCLHCTTTPEEFETAWIDIMKMYNLE